jgi:hypothetical protein
MKKQETADRGQGSESLEKLLRAAVPRVEEDADLARDLWPAMLRRLDQQPVAVPWFDWVLMGGLAAAVAAFPAAIPMLLYYL